MGSTGIGRLGHIDVCENLRGLGDTGQTLVDHRGAEMLEVEMDVILLAAHTATAANLHRHRATHDVA